MLLALLSCTLSGFAEKTPIEIEVVKLPQGRSGVLLPTASIDGQVLTIDFVVSCEFEVSVVDVSGAVVFIGTCNSQSAVITLPNLPCGDYKLEIEDATHIYSGEFEVN